MHTDDDTRRLTLNRFDAMVNQKRVEKERQKH